MVLFDDNGPRPSIGIGLLGRSQAASDDGDGGGGVDDPEQTCEPQPSRREPSRGVVERWNGYDGVAVGCDGWPVLHAPRQSRDRRGSGDAHSVFRDACLGGERGRLPDHKR